MKLKQLLEQLNQLAKERPEALEMEVIIYDRNYCEDMQIHFVTEGDIDGKQCVLIAFEEELDESKLF